MTNDKFKYIRFDQLLASVRLDLQLFDDNGYILPDRLLKIIYRCNEKLGFKINKSKQCLINIENGRGDLPSDFYKIEMVFATCTTTIPNHLQTIPGNKATFTTCPPKDTVPTITVEKLGCKDVCNNTTWIVRELPVFREVELQTIIPLNMSRSCTQSCTTYCPGTNTKNGQYGIDLTENQVVTTFKEGQIFLCYLGALEDDDGEILIPFHPLLNNYYEYSLKVKILEDIFLNSEADVEKKLAYVKQELSNAYFEAWQFTGYPEYRELEDFNKRDEMKFYNTWYKPFQ